MIRSLISLASRPAVRLLLPPIAGFFFYGGWAYLANFGHSSTAAFKAFFTQGSYSFVITLTLALAIEGMFRWMKKIAYRACWVTLIACLMLYSSSWTVNYIAGTPNIILTILPGAIVSTVYTILYVWTLNKVSRLPSS